MLGQNSHAATPSHPSAEVRAIVSLAHCSSRGSLTTPVGSGLTPPEHSPGGASSELHAVTERRAAARPDRGGGRGVPRQGGPDREGHGAPRWGGAAVRPDGEGPRCAQGSQPIRAPETVLGRRLLSQPPHLAEHES